MDRRPLHQAVRPVTERAKLCVLLVACEGIGVLNQRRFPALPAVALGAKYSEAISPPVPEVLEGSFVQASLCQAILV